MKFISLAKLGQIDKEKLMICKAKTKQCVELIDKLAKIDCYNV